MTALHDFIQAAASYFGVPPDQLTEGSTLDASRGDLEVVLRIGLTPEDVTGIAGRMARMVVEREVDEAQAQALMARERDKVPTREQLRAEYNGMPATERSKFGSFARFVAMRGGEDPFAEPVVLPPHVYLSPSEATEQQKAMAVGRDARGWFALDPADLTEQQRAKLWTVPEGLTSNADDFGGLPG